LIPLLCLAGLAPRSDAQPTQAPTPTTWCFASGLRVALQPGPDAAMSIVAVVDGGSGGDPADRAGLAHVVEHMWFRTPGMVATEAVTGARTNASTTADETRFTTTAHRRFVRQLLQTEVDRLRDPIAGIEQPALDAEREVVRNELRMRYEVTGQVGLLHVMPLLFDREHPYHHATIGTHESLSAITLDDLRAYADRWYTPANTTWYLSTDLAPDKVARLLEEALTPDLRHAPGADPTGSPLVPCAARPDPEHEVPAPAAWQPGDALPRQYAAVPGPTLMLGWATPPGQYQSIATGSVLAHLEREIEQADVGQAQCGLRPGRLASVGWCTVHLSSESGGPGARPEEALERISRGARAWWWDRRELTSQLFSDRVDAREELLDGMEQTDAVVSDRPVRTAVLFHRTGNPDGLMAELASLQGQSLSEVISFAETWLTPERMAAVVLEPDPSGGWPATLHSLRDQPPVPAADAASVDAARLETFAVEPDLSRLEEYTLDNGMTVHLLPFGTFPIVRSALVLRGGPEWSEAPLAANSLVQSFSTYGKWRFGFGERHVAARLDHSDGPALVNRLRGWVDDNAPVKPPALGRWRREIKAELGRLFESREYAIGVLESEHVHPGRLRWLTDPAHQAEQLAAVTRAQLLAIHRAVVRPERAHLFVVGRFEPEQVRAAIATEFRSWRGHPSLVPALTRPEPAPMPAARAVHVVEDDVERVLASVTASCRVGGELRSDAEWDILGALVRQRLTERLRDEAAATYNVQLVADPSEHGGALHAGSLVPHEATGLAVATILGVWGEAADGIDPDTLAAHKLAAAKASPLRWRTTTELLDWLISAAVHDQPSKAIGDVVSRLDEVTPERLAQRMAPCRGGEIVVVVGDPERVGPSLDEAGIPWTSWSPTPAPR
jgi:zinc protease